MLHGQHVAIDLFFRTLAETHGPNAAAVVLSGTGSDGSSGLKRVKELGGVTFAQDPQDAEYDSMPRNAIATGLVDYVLPVAAMPDQLLAYIGNAEKIRLPIADQAPLGDQAAALREIFVLMRVRTGHDFSNYKRATMLRRIGRRMQVHGIAEVGEYVATLRERSGERCRMITNARSLSLRMCWKNCCRAFSPPADAPMPTIDGPLKGRPSSDGWVCASGSGISESLTCFSICCGCAAPARALIPARAMSIPSNEPRRAIRDLFKLGLSLAGHFNFLSPSKMFSPLNARSA
jgi:hypothetical protein